MKRFDVHLVITTDNPSMPSRRISEDVNRLLIDGLPDGTLVAAITTADSLAALLETMRPRKVSLQDLAPREAKHEGQN